MMPRQMVQWRIYVYANSLYSLPGQEVRAYRDWSPEAYNSYHIHRVMNWVNRDVSVLLRVKSEVYTVFELILDMLPLMSMRSDQFKESLVKYLGSKTNHFVHELINFARSPYENMIAYECNVQYKAVREDDYDRPSTSAEARRLGQFMSPGLHNFVEFSRRINPDDCGGFEADLQMEDEDAEELDDLILERRDVSVMMLAMADGAVPSRSLTRQLAASIPSGIAMVAPPTAATASVSFSTSVMASSSVASSSSVAASSSVGESQQQSTLEEPPLPSRTDMSHNASPSAFSNYELQLAIERSMREDGFGFASDWGMVPPSSGRTVVLSNRQLARSVIASNLYRIAHGPSSGATGLLPVPGAATGGIAGRAARGSAGRATGVSVEGAAGGLAGGTSGGGDVGTDGGTAGGAAGGPAGGAVGGTAAEAAGGSGTGAGSGVVGGTAGVEGSAATAGGGATEAGAAAAVLNAQNALNTAVRGRVRSRIRRVRSRR